MKVAAMDYPAVDRQPTTQTDVIDGGLDRFGLDSRYASRAGALHWRHWIPIRTLSERYRRRVEQHLLQLDAHDRYLRFGATTSDEQISQYVQRLDFKRDEIFGIFNRSLQLVAVAHLAYSAPIRKTNQHEFVEFGVSVLPHARGRGYGNRLFRHAILHARNRHTHTLFIHALTENAAMLNIALRNGASLEYWGPDATAWLRLPTDTVTSHVGSAVESGAAELNYGLRRQVLRVVDWVGRRLGAW